MDFKGKEAASVDQELVPLELYDAETNLCDFCNSIDFGRIGFYKPGSDMGQLFNEFRPLREVLQSSTKCFFCRKVADFCDDWSRRKFDKKAADLQGETNEVDYAIEPLHLPDRDTVDEPMGALVRLKVGFNIVEPSREGKAYGPTLQFQKCSQHPPKVEDFCNGGSLLDRECGDEQPQAYSGRIRPLVADTRLFCKWRETCCRIHGDHCNSIFKSGSRRPPPLRLVDVKRRCIVDSEVGISYAALSYVWGENIEFLKLTKSTEALLRLEGSLNSKTLPVTVDDAIEVAKRLEEKYIWVDRLCIRQDDKADKQELLPKMDSIFGCASVTIVAASGDNANAGLPGVRPNSRTHVQRPFTIKGVSLLQTLDPECSGDVMSYLGESPWYTRGWTFQERIFSRRVLIFAPEQVYWECQRSTWCEDGFWETSLEASPAVYRHCFSEKDFCHPWSPEVDSFERLYRKLVEEYSRRMLTFDHDGLNAFAGILNAFEAEAGQRFLWALPTSFLSSALTWRCSRGQYKRRTEECTVKLEGGSSSGGTKFTHCGFPSWSWVGWIGVICIGSSHGRLNAKAVDLVFYYVDAAGSGVLRLVHATGATQSLSVLLVRQDHDRTDVDRGDIPERVLARSIASNMLFFWSSSAILRVAHGDVDSHGKDPELTLTDHNGNDVAARFWFHTPGQEELPGEFEFVVIGKFTEYSELADFIMTREALDRDEGLLALLLVRWDDGVAYRKGLVHIHFGDWVALEDREWKLICLG